LTERNTTKTGLTQNHLNRVTSGSVPPVTSPPTAPPMPPNLASDVLQVLPVESTTPSRHEAPVQRDGEDEVQDGDDDDEETCGDVRGVGEDRVEVAEEEGEGNDGGKEGEDRAKESRGDEGEPLQKREPSVLLQSKMRDQDALKRGSKPLQSSRKR
jgi:hypothetical protein